MILTQFLFFFGQILLGDLGVFQCFHCNWVFIIFGYIDQLKSFVQLISIGVNMFQTIPLTRISRGMCTTTQTVLLPGRTRS